MTHTKPLLLINRIMRLISFALVFLIVLQACIDKNVMSNALGEDDVDVGKFLKNGYKAFYCKGKIEKLIRIQPDMRMGESWPQVKHAIAEWISSNTYSTDIDIEKFKESIVYQYSYLKTYTPVDVY